VVEAVDVGARLILAVERSRAESTWVGLTLA
jgi:hypothetical protein